MTPNVVKGRKPHFSLQVLLVQSAYIRAAGSEFARKPTSKGARGSLESPSDTSERRNFATVPARTTLQEAGSDSLLAIAARILLLTIAMENGHNRMNSEGINQGDCHLEFLRGEKTITDSRAAILVKFKLRHTIRTKSILEYQAIVPERIMGLSAKSGM